MPVRIEVYTRRGGSTALVKRAKQAALELAAEYGIRVRLTVYRLPLDAEWLPSVRVGSRVLGSDVSVERIVEAALASAVEEVVGASRMVAATV